MQPQRQQKTVKSTQIDVSFWEYAEQYFVYIYLIFESQNRMILQRAVRNSVSTEVKVIRENVIFLDHSKWVFACFV